MKKLFIIISLLFIYSCGSDNIQENIDTPDNSSNQEKQENQNSNSGVILLEKGEFAQAVDYYENNNSTEDINEVKAYLNYGNAYYQEKKYADKALNILSELDENSYENLYYKGYANEILANYNESISYYEQALELENITNKQKAILLNQVGHVYDLMGEIQKANEYYVESEEYGFELIGNILNRGRYEYRDGNTEQAKDYFEKIIEKETIDSFLLAEVYFNLSSIYLSEEGEEEQAIELANRGIEINENYPQNYLNIGIANMYLGDENFENSPDYFNKVLELYPNSASAYKYLGIYNYISDDFEKAIENFEKQLEKSMEDIVLMGDDKTRFYNDALYDLSLSYSLNGDSEKAIENLEKLLIENTNEKFYYQLLTDLSREDSPFENIVENENFQNSIKSIIENYN